ncbi:DUF1365 domain-containing protein [Catenulispora yoronensis]|uniref:DUF1365 domain-containing protein n=1 Tax=Catenulispora yoronensis TaxID=450799 RepID=UPI0031DAC961
MNAPALYECRIRHVRHGPVVNDFTYGSYLWLVDLDDLPRLPGPLRLLAGFPAADHFSGRDGSVRGGVERFLAAHGIELNGGRILTLTAARVFGYVFNPLTVHWCHDADDRLVCVVAEVHNTYGERHAYLLFPDAEGRAQTDKDFYVSPFLPIEGGVYRMRLPEPGERLSLSVRLDLPGAAPFVASVHGVRRAGTASGLLRLAARYPLAPLAVAARIRRQGVALFLRGLPVVPRSHRGNLRAGSGAASAVAGATAAAAREGCEHARR